MSPKLLAERQAEMRARLAREKKSRDRPSLQVEDEPPVSKSDNEPQEATIVKQPNGSTTISRQDLYNLIWSEPVIKVATRFGVSDVAVAKACRKHQIPVPGRGYWACMAAGQRMPKSPLPTSNSASHTITFARMPDDATRIKRSEIPEIQNERSSENRIVVSDEPSDLHPLVSRTLVFLSRAKPNAIGMLEPPQDGIGLYVSQGQLTRGITVMDALVKALNSRGHNVAIFEQPERKHRSYSYLDRFAKWKPFVRTRATVNGEHIGFALCESTKRVPHVPTILEKRKLDKGDRYGILEHDEIPSGELTLWMDVSDRLGIRAQWSDGKRQRVENCLNSFIAGLISAAHAIKKQREDEERRRREREEEERRYAEAQRRRWQEQQRVEKLDQQMSNWKRAQDIRTYGQAIEEFAVRNYGKLEPESELGKWVSWIRRYADKIDPLNPSEDD